MSDSSTIASLAVDVAANIAELREGFREANVEAKRQFSDMERNVTGSLRSIEDTAKRVGQTLLASLGIASVAELTKSIIETNAHLVDMAQQVSINVTKLSQLSVAAQLAGTDIDGVAQSLGIMSKNAMAAYSGNKQLQAVFNSLGISVRDANGQLKSTDDLFDEVAVRFSNMHEGIGRTSAAIALFGRNGKQLIPMLIEYGRNVEAATAKAERLGVVVSQSDADAFKKLNDTMQEISIAIRGDFTQALTVLVPYLQDGADAALDFATNSASIKEQLYEAITVIHQVSDAVHDLFGDLQEDTENTPFITGILKGMTNDMDAFSRMAADVKKLGAELRLGFNIAWTGGNPDQSEIDVFNRSMDDIEATLERNIATHHEWERSVRDSGAVLSALSDAVRTVNGTIKDGHLTAGQYAKDMEIIGKLGESARQQGADQAQVERIVNAEYRSLSDTLDRSMKPAYNGFNASVGETNKALREQAKALEASQKFLDDYADKYNKWVVQTNKGLDAIEAQISPLARLNKEYEAQNNALDEAELLYRDNAVQMHRIAQDRAALTLEYNRAKIAASELLKPEEQLVKDLDDQIRLLTLSADARKVEAEVLRVSKGLSVQQIDQLRQEVDVREQLIKQLAEHQRAVEEFQNILTDGFNSAADAMAGFIVDGMHDWKNFGQALVDITKRMVKEIIAEIIKLNVVEPLLKALFGFGTGGGGGWSALLSALGFGAIGAAGGGSAAATFYNMGYNPTGMQGGNAGTTLMNYGLNWGLNQAGSAGWNYLTTGSFAGAGNQTMMGSLFGTGDFDMGWGNMLSSGGGIGGALGTMGGVLGGAYIGNRFGGTGGAIAGGAGLGVASYFVPVIGWIAGIASLIDMVSGGKLFGTKWSPKDFGQGVKIDQSGGSAYAFQHDTKQGAFFSGTQHRLQWLEASPELEDAADQVFSLVEKELTKAATKLGIEVPDIISGSFESLTDKKGNLKSQTSTVLGKQYQEDFEAFQKRLVAENIIGAVDVSIAALATSTHDMNQAITDSGDQVGKVVDGFTKDATDAQTATGDAIATAGEASQIAERWRANAEQLLEGAQFLEQAQADVAHGISLIKDGTLTDIADVTQELTQEGETLSETYARLQQETMLLDTAMSALHVDLGKTGTQMVEFADAVAQAAGGFDQVNALWQSFFTNYTDGIEVMRAQAEATRQQIETTLGAVGLSIGMTMDEAEQLFVKALPNATAEQVAQWLIALDTLAKLTQSTKDANEQYMELMATVRGVTLSPFRKAIAGIEAQERSFVTQANQLAIAAGHAGASERDLAAIHRWAANQVRLAIATLKASTMDLISQLYGGTPGTLDEVNRRIAAEEAAHQQELSGIRDVAQANQDRYRAELDAIKGIQDFLDNLMLGDLSTLTPQQQLMEAQQQYEDLLARAQAGDAEALAALPEAAQQYLQIARGYYSATSDYTDIFNQVTADLANIVGQGAGAPPGGLGDGGGGATIGELEALYAQQDQLQAEQAARDRQALANQLAQSLGDLAQALGIPVFQLASDMHVDLTQLAEDLGINLQELTSTTGEQLGLMAAELGVSVPELTAQLGISFSDLVEGMGINLDDLTQNTAQAIGDVAATLGLTVPELTAALGINMSDLVAALGINLDDLTVQTVEAMAAMAEDMGISLVDLATSVGVDLGDLADSQSLLNQALGDTIDTLPQGTRDQLQPLFDAIAEATTEADANEAVNNLHDAVALLPEDQRDLLAPFFDDLLTPDDMTDLDFLSQIADYNSEALDWLREIADNTYNWPGAGAGGHSMGAMEYNPSNAAAMATYGVDLNEASGSSQVARAIDTLRECIEDSDEATRQVLIDRLNSLEDSMEESAVKTAMVIGKATSKRGGGYGN